MGDFTEAETSYKELFEAVKKTLPPSYGSIFSIDISTKESLLQTLLHFYTVHYHKSSTVTNAGAFFNNLPSDKIKFSLNNSGSKVLNLRSKKPSDKNDLIDELFENIMKYLPALSFEPQVHNDFLNSPANKEFTKIFLKHLEINRSLLLDGPPNANEYGKDPEKGAIWIAAQKTPERQRLARLLYNEIRYISHTEFLEALQYCVGEAKKRLKPGPVIFITGNPQKSNYYCSLLFAHYWLKEGLPIDCAISDFKNLQSTNLSGNFLDIDDMSYSGSQTETMLQRKFKMFANLFRNQLKDRLSSNEGFKNSYYVLPRHLIDQVLQINGFSYLVIRAFMTEKSFERLTEHDITKLPFDIITRERIAYMPSISPEDQKKIQYLFNEEVYSTVYFDHKVADFPSTYLLPIATGIVPEKMIYRNLASNELNSSLFNNIEGEGVEFLPFLRHCSPSERKLPKNRKNIFATDMANEYRCPFAWYKKIDYESGTYTPPSRTGGKRKTKKQKRKTKGKTRSSSK